MIDCTQAIELMANRLVDEFISAVMGVHGLDVWDEHSVDVGALMATLRAQHIANLQWMADELI